MPLGRKDTKAGIAALRKFAFQVVVGVCAWLLFIVSPGVGYSAGWTDLGNYGYVRGAIVGTADGNVFFSVGCRNDEGEWYYYIRNFNAGSSFYVGYQISAPAIAVSRTGTAWVYAGGSGGNWPFNQARLYKQSGSTFVVVREWSSYQSSAPVLVAGPDGLWLNDGGRYYVTTDGVNFADRGPVQGILFVGPDGYVWEGRGAGVFYRWKNGAWELVNAVADPSGGSTERYYSAAGGVWRQYRKWVGWSTYCYWSFWNGQDWVIRDTSPYYEAYSGTVAPDGSLWVACTGNFGGSVYRFDGTNWVYMGGGSESSRWRISSIGVTKDYIYLNGYGAYTSDSMLRRYGVIPAPSSPSVASIGQTQATINLGGQFADVVVSTDGTNWDLARGAGFGNGTITGLQPGTRHWVKTYWIDSVSGFTLGGGTLQFRTVPATPTAPTGTVSRVSWSATVGRGRVVLNWQPVTGATGYAVWVFDGNVYRRFDVGNATTWDSSAARIYPDPNWLAAQPDNSISSDPFNHAGGGFDLQDDPNLLYRKTVGTIYDNAHNYWFRVSAYNESGESPYSSSAWTPTLPTATDPQAPSASVSAVSKEGLEKTFSPDIRVTVSASDSLSGIYKVELSNDGVTYTTKYTATKNADGGTSVASYSNTFDWTVPLGAGTKVVYVRVTDAVGNSTVTTDTVALAEDMLPPSVSLKINNGAESTTSPNVTLTLAVQDNASAASQMQMRFSNDGNLWSPWEAFQQTKAWDITASAYGGTSSAGIKKVYAQVCDQAQNVALAAAEIGYNPSPPTGTVSIVGGSSGTWNGKPALFTASDGPTLNLNFPGAAQVRFDPGTGIWGDWESYASQKTVYLVKSQGACRLRVQVKDAYGVISAAQEFLVVVDPVPPTISRLRGLNGATATHTSSTTLEIAATDNLPGTLQYRWQANGGAWSSWANLTGSTISVSSLVSGANRITVEVKDQAGNTAQAAVTIFRI